MFKSLRKIKLNYLKLKKLCKQKKKIYIYIYILELKQF